MVRFTANTVVVDNSDEEFILFPCLRQRRLRRDSQRKVFIAGLAPNIVDTSCVLLFCWGRATELLCSAGK